MTGKIKKRNGEIVDFSGEKIAVAITKAFRAVRGQADEVKISEMTNVILSDLERYFVEKTPSVEDVQNLVEKVLMEGGFFDVAKSYIIYRYEHAKYREQKKQDVLEKIEKNDLVVVKRSGKQEKFSSRKLRRSLTWAIEGLEADIDADLVVQICESNLYDGITTKDIAKALVLATRSLIERDPAYSQISARLQFAILVKDIIGPEKIDYKIYDEQYQQAFIAGIKKGVEIDRLDPRLLNFDLESLSKKIKPQRDDLFRYLGAQTLYDRYFISHPETKQVLETPQGFWMRVAMGLAIQEEQKEQRAAEFYEAMSTLRFVPSTPTLFHAGGTHPQLSSCYLTTIDDSLDHIFKCIGDNAQLSKWSGGIGNDWTNLRGTGAFIKGTGVESQGVIPFLKIANDTTVAINRSGRRRGATCAYLETWHYDIEDFLELRKNTGDERRRTHDMNTANWIPDLFMKRVLENGDWTLLSPDEAADLHHLYGSNFEKRYLHYERLAKEGKLHLFKTVKAKNLWKKMIMMLFETGHPWITWKDPCNVRSPQDHVGIVHSSNLCTEITLNTSPDETAVCNLGSVNLARHIKDKQLDRELIQQTVTVAMRMLDNVIDINFYPTAEAKNSNLRHRPVGLGVMGFQDALYLLGINFDTDDAVEFADQTQEAIAYHAILASTALAEERGTYQSFKGSKWDRGLLPLDTLALLEEERGMKIDVPRTSRLDWQVVRSAIKQHGMRNSNCMAVAPTATIANIAGCFPTIEPIYKNVYVKSNMSGEFTVINHFLVNDLKERNLWNTEILEQIKGNDGNINRINQIPDDLKEKYKEVFDIGSEWLVKSAAYRGKWIDQSQSLNLYVSHKSGSKISEMYQYAWSMGLKTTYYLRSLAATTVEKSTLELAQQGLMPAQAENTSIKKEAVGAPQPNAAGEGKPLVEPIFEPLVAAQTAVEIQPIKSTTVPLCKIDDPYCEACQ
ncbi:MAG: ribonucleoside-diphosphate reductase subunit alpha [Candidatus Buchananbacteria bacterium RIFCSPHIGHO2_01_FULL_47_11b]|uniref:Ribonucleoside-diphosphate reductase n=1 Tax=Candidatus Buchananbacteria bacterium RIFCSPHIGHO2_01_FULL_47_11b TaxID=1797537 RepID=A0A1G1Y410_9BACT|nr:MAG: ribonucleoside-diphosphate reductase subunit alpha [Candidatus Buchananbacteria bacterium RIFCSPHIGHO2_01_FULL_47_11b]